MSHFCRLSHAIWHCKYHLVWVLKYRYRVLKGKVGKEVYNCIQIFCGQKECEVLELNAQPDHVHLVVMVPPKVSISELVGILKGRTAIRYIRKYSVNPVSNIKKLLFSNDENTINCIYWSYSNSYSSANLFNSVG